MAQCQRILALANTPIRNALTRNIHTSNTAYIDMRWRKQKGLALNFTAFGPLTNLPDYTFKDGRPTPFGSRQTSRINKQKDYLARINKLTAEIDYAVERHAKLQKEAEEEKRKILEQKLKPKDTVLLD